MEFLLLLFGISVCIFFLYYTFTEFVPEAYMYFIEGNLKDGFSWAFLVLVNITGALLVLIYVFKSVDIDIGFSIRKAKERRTRRKEKRIEKKKEKEIMEAAEKQRIAALPKSHGTVKEISKVRKLSKHPEFIDVLQSIEKTTKALEKNKALGNISEKEVNRRIEYYLPLALKLAKTHITLENNGIELDEEDQMQEKIINSLCEINNALIKMNENIFDAVELDLDTEMEAWETVITKDGFNKKDF